MNRTSVNLWDALFGERVEVRLKTSSGVRVVRVTRRWLERMEAQGLFGPERVGVVAHIIDVDNSTIEEIWTLGEDISDEDHERWLDPETETVYAMRYLNDGYLVQRFLTKRVWDRAARQLLGQPAERAKKRSLEQQMEILRGVKEALLESAKHPEALPMSIDCDVPSGTVGRPYVHQLTSKGAGNRPRTWRLESGSALPPGLHLSPDGKLSGTPVAEGETYFRVVVTDDGGYKVPGEITLNVWDWEPE